MHPRGFSGGVYSKEVEWGYARADIELTSKGISAMTGDGHEFFISYVECQLIIGGFNGRTHFCRNTGRSITVFCDNTQFGQALVESSLGLLAGQLEMQRTKRSRNRIGAPSRLLAILLGY
jgi:hypothetical protein